jgi:hypothetical protein
MSLTAIYLQHRMQLLERHVSTVVQFLKSRQTEDAEELAYLERVWQAECETLHVAFMNGNKAFFEERENDAARRRDGDDWDAQ